MSFIIEERRNKSYNICNRPFTEGYEMENKSLIKSIGGDVWKLIQTHIVMLIFGVMVYLPVGAETESRRILTVVFSILTVIFYYYLIDLYMWDVGARDAVSARGAGTKPNIFKGFIAGLFAAIPDMVLGIAFFIINHYREYSDGLSAANGVFALITQTWEGMFMGIKMSLIGKSGGAWFYLVTPIIAAALAGFSYFCGTKEFTVIPRPKKAKE